MAEKPNFASDRAVKEPEEHFCVFCRHRWAGGILGALEHCGDCHREFLKLKTAAEGQVSSPQLPVLTESQAIKAYVAAGHPAVVTDVRLAEVSSPQYDIRLMTDFQIVEVLKARAAHDANNEFGQWIGRLLTAWVTDSPLADIDNILSERLRADVSSPARPKSTWFVQLDALIGLLEEGIENEEFGRQLNRAGADALGKPYDDSNETPMPFARAFKSHVEAMRAALAEGAASSPTVENETKD